jgi:integrase
MSKVIAGGEMARIECPKCQSKKNWKSGKRETTIGYVQRYVCRDCSFRFSDKSYIEYEQKENRQLCVILQDAKKLDTATETKTVVGDIKNTKASNSEIIVNHLWYMKKQGYAEQTIIRSDKILRRLDALGADLNYPESVKEVIALKQNWQNSMKQTVVFCYDRLVKQQKLTWERPRYKAVEKNYTLPYDREVDDVLAGCTNEIALFIQIGKDTGARPGEIFQLQWQDIDMERREVRITPEKGSKPRTLRLSNDSLRIISSKPRISQRIFTGYKNLNNLRRSYQRCRNRQAAKLANPRLRQIKLHDLRHLKASKEMERTGSLSRTMEITGHKTYRSLEVYLHKLPHVESDPEYVSQVAKTVPEIQALVDKGFEYVQSVDGIHIYRKRK